MACINGSDRLEEVKTTGVPASKTELQDREATTEKA